MPTRILSWSQMVREADPNYDRANRSPWVYQFSNGRRFYQTNPVYTPFSIHPVGTGGIIADDGTPIIADDGTPIIPDAAGQFPVTTGYMLDDAGNIMRDSDGEPMLDV